MWDLSALLMNEQYLRDFSVSTRRYFYLFEHHAVRPQFYDDGREIVTYTGFDELLGEIRWLLPSLSNRGDPQYRQGACSAPTYLGNVF